MVLFHLNEWNQVNAFYLGVIHSLRNAKFTVFETPYPYRNTPYYSSPNELKNCVTNRGTFPPP